MGQLTNLYVSESFQGLLKLANSTTGVTGTLQYVQDGIGNNIPMLVSTSSVVITGSFRGDGSGLTGITVDSGSLVTTSSFNAFTASIDGRVDALELETGSLQNQINQKLDTGSFNSYTSSNDAKVNALINATGSYATTSSLTSLSQSIATTDLSQDNRLTSIEGVTGSFASTASLNSYTLTSSFNAYTSSADGRLSSLESATSSLQNQINQKLDTGSFNSYTSSNDAKVNSLINATGSYATTGSNSFQGNQNITGSLGVTGEITALSASITYLKTIYQTSSVIFTSGSNILGDEAGDTQTLNGTVNVPLGNLNVTGATTSSLGFFGNLQGTASYATNALSSSHSVNADTASYVLNAVSSSYSSFALSSSFAQNATSASYSLNSTSASFSQNTISSSFSDFAVSSSYSLNNLSSSHAINADTASFATSTISSSFATNAATASIANDVIVRGKCDNTGGLLRGTIVRISGADGDNPLFNSASWTDDANSANTLGMLSEDVAHNGFANVVVLGKVIGVNTSGMTAGSNLYLSSSGQYTTSSVPAPYHEVRLGQVLRDNTNNGSVYITIDNGYELTELHDVDITSETVGDVLTYVSGSYGQWVNKTVDELGYLQTSSFNTYTASMDARTGSYATTGSNVFKGNQIITGSLDIRSGSLDLFSNNTTVNTDLYLTNSLGGQSNIILGWGDNPSALGPSATQANYTGSLRITGSNNIVAMPTLRATGLNGTADQQAYISGSGNIILGNIGNIFLSTGSLLFPKTQGNIIGIGSAIYLTYTSSSLAQGHPVISNNILNGAAVIINTPSGSGNFNSNYVLNGTVTSTQTFTSNNRNTIVANNIINSVTLNSISSSISYQNNYNNAPITINNHLSSSGLVAGNLFNFTNNAVFGGTSNTGLSVWVSGSQSSQTNRNIMDNIIGGKNITISSSFVSSSNSSLVSSIVYGQNLIVSGNHAATVGGSTFLGRYNDATSLHLAQDIVLAVGTGTGTSNRRTGFYITSGSLVGISGSLDVKGGSTTITGSVQGNVLPLTVASNTASLNLNNGNFFELALTGSQDIRIEPSNIKPGQTVSIKLNTTGSGTVSFPTTVKQASGSAYTPTTAVGTDIITLVSFDTSNVYLANVKNLI